MELAACDLSPVVSYRRLETLRTFDHAMVVSLSQCVLMYALMYMYIHMYAYVRMYVLMYVWMCVNV